jgi:hypothetical protein
MSTTQAAPVAPRLTIPPGDAGDPDRTAASAPSQGISPAGLEGSAGTLAALLPWFTEGVGGAAPTPWLVSTTVAGKGSGAGYAKAATSGTAQASSGSRLTGEWAFLSDPSLSVEEKLSRFMIAVQKKLGDELTDKMNDYKAKYGEGGTETEKQGSGGFLGSILGAIFPSGGVFDKILGGLEELLGSALKSLGGPLLAALATAVGLPMLAPAALKLGESLGGALAGAVSSGKPKSTSTGTTKTDKPSNPKTTTPSTTKGDAAKKGEAGSPDERLEMLEIQRLVEKQNQMFTLVSNLLKSMNDTAMVAIQNVR